MQLTIPHDVLRLIFEIVAIEDRRAALKLVVISHLIQLWYVCKLGYLTARMV